VSRAYRLLVQALAGSAAVLLGLTALAVTIDVLARNVGLGAFPWVLEASEYALPASTFLVAPWLLVRNEHVRLDLLLQTLPRGPARLLDATANVFGLAISATLVVYGVRAITNSMQQGAMVIKSLVFPEWWLYVPVPLCFSLLAFEFGRRLAVRGAHEPGADLTAR